MRHGTLLRPPGVESRAGDTRSVCLSVCPQGQCCFFRSALLPLPQSSPGLGNFFTLYGSQEQTPLPKTLAITCLTCRDPCFEVGVQKRVLAGPPKACAHPADSVAWSHRYLTPGSSSPLGPQRSAPTGPPPEMAVCGTLTPLGLKAPAVHQICHLPVSKSLPFPGTHITEMPRVDFFPS